MTARGRARILALIGGASLALALLAPVAHAQADDVTGDATTSTTSDTGSLADPVGTVTDTVGSVIDGGGTSSTTDPIGGTIDTVTDTLDGGGSTTNTSLVDDPVTKVVDDVKKTVADTSGGVTNDVHETLGGVTNTVDDTTVSTIDKVNGTVGGTLNGNDPKSKTRKGRKTSSTPTSAQTSRSSILGVSFADAMRHDSRAIASSPSVAEIALDSTVGAGTSLAEQVGRIAQAAAERMAFPALLMAIVIGFLMIQNRIDRRDAKLAMAPVDSEHDLLSFS